MIHLSRRISSLLIPACLLLLIPLVFSYPETCSANDEPQASSRIATLHFYDPLLSQMSLRDGGPGNVFDKNGVYNRQSDIDYSHIRKGELSVGIEGGNQGRIVDLGSAEDLSERYGYEETNSGGQGYAAIGLRLGKIALLKNYRIKNTTHLAEAERLFLEWDREMSHAPVHLGHIYLVRITGREGGDFELIAKMKVIGYSQGESVTFRWDIIKYTP